MPLEFAGLSEQRREVGAVEVDLRGFLDADQSAERGKKVDDTGGFVLDGRRGFRPSSKRCRVRDAHPRMRSFSAAEFSATARVGSCRCRRSRQ